MMSVHQGQKEQEKVEIIKMFGQKGFNLRQVLQQIDQEFGRILINVLINGDKELYRHFWQS